MCCVLCVCALGEGSVFEVQGILPFACVCVYGLVCLLCVSTW